MNSDQFRKYLKAKGLDIDLYKPIGIRTHFQDGEYDYSIICLNPEDLENKELLDVHLNPSLTVEDFNNLFDNYSSFVIDASVVDISKVEELSEKHIDISAED